MIDTLEIISHRTNLIYMIDYELEIVELTNSTTVERQNVKLNSSKIEYIYMSNDKIVNVYIAPLIQRIKRTREREKRK